MQSDQPAFAHKVAFRDIRVAEVDCANWLGSGLMLLMQWSSANFFSASGDLFTASEHREQRMEEDLLMALAGLDLQVLFFLDKRPDSVHQQMIDGANLIIRCMPSGKFFLHCNKPQALSELRSQSTPFWLQMLLLAVRRSCCNTRLTSWSEFETLQSIRRFWSLIMRRNFHFRRLVLIRSVSHEPEHKWKYSEASPWEDSANIYPGGNMFR